MNTNNKRTYQPPTCFCVEVHNKTLLCNSNFNTDDPKEMEEEDYAGVKTQSIWDLYIK